MGRGGREKERLPQFPPPLPKKTSSTEGETLKPITNSSALLDLNYLLPMRNTPKMELQAVSRQPGAVENQASTHDVYSSVALKTLLLLKVLYIITSVPCTPWIHVYLQGFLGNTWYRYHTAKQTVTNCWQILPHTTNMTQHLHNVHVHVHLMI